MADFCRPPDERVQNGVPQSLKYGFVQEGRRPYDAVTEVLAAEDPRVRELAGYFVRLTSDLRREQGIAAVGAASYIIQLIDAGQGPDAGAISGLTDGISEGSGTTGTNEL